MTIIGVNHGNKSKYEEKYKGYDNIILIPEIFLESLTNQKKYQIIHGSRISAKSWTKAIHFLYKCSQQSHFRGIYSRNTQKAARDSQFQLFKDTLNRYPLLRQQFTIHETPMRITHNGTGNFMQGGSFEDPASLMSVPDITDFWAEEPISRSGSIDRESFYDIVGMISRTSNPQFHFTFNPINKKNFIYEDFFSDERLYDEEDTYYLLANYDSNPFASQASIDFLEKLKRIDPDRYLVDGLGIFGNTRTGSEYYYNFKRAIHTGDYKYQDGLPLHVTLDFNNLPYMTMNVAQIPYVNGKHQLTIIKSYSNKPPLNTIESTCERFLQDFMFHLKKGYGMYLYGDTSGNNTMPIRKNSSFYEIVVANMQGYISWDSIRLLKSNPRHEQRMPVFNQILSDEEELIVRLDVSCSDLSNDMEEVTMDANGGKFKPKKKIDGVTIETHGHHTDSVDYMLFYLLKYHYPVVAV